MHASSMIKVLVAVLAASSPAFAELSVSIRNLLYGL
jgi:hypothetical protein